MLCSRIQVIPAPNSNLKMWFIRRTLCTTSTLYVQLKIQDGFLLEDQDEHFIRHMYLQAQSVIPHGIRWRILKYPRKLIDD